MAKVALSTKVSEELKAELEEQAKEKDITLSEHVANLLTDSKDASENTEQEFNNLIKELNEKNSQIKELLEMQKNEQEVRLYREKILLIEKEQEQEKISIINEPNKTEETGSLKPEKKWWKFWRTNS